MDAVPDPAPIADQTLTQAQVPIVEDSEIEEEDCSEPKELEFIPDPLINEESSEHLFQNEAEASEQFPEYFDSDLDGQDGREAAADHPDSHDGREATADHPDSQPEEGCKATVDFDYEHLACLTPQEATSIALYKGKIEYNVTHDAYKYFCKVVSKRTKLHILDLRTIHKAIQCLTGVAHVSYDVCINNCICFAEYPEQLSCPLCGEARYRCIGHKDIPRKTFDYIPVQHCLRLLYSDPKAARDLKSYLKKLEDTAEGVVLRDFWDANLCAELKKKGILTDPRSLAFYFSTDGVCLFRKDRQHSVHPLLLINYNLHPKLRFQKENIIFLGIIPGPKKPKDLLVLALQVSLFPLKAQCSGSSGCCQGERQWWWV